MCKEQYIYIETDSTDAAFNFAVEYYLATERPFPGKTVVPIWRTAPTVMVGRFQNTFAEINRAYVEKKQIAVARRMSGGGTIYTDFGAWQYSFITFAKGKASGMRELAAPVVDILRKLGAPAEFSGRNDILIEGRKVLARHSTERTAVWFITALCCTRRIWTRSSAAPTSAVRSCRRRASSLSGRELGTFQTTCRRRFP